MAHKRLVLGVLLGLMPALVMAEWLPERRLATTSGRSEQAVLAASGCNVYAAWLDNTDFFWKVFFARSRNGGVTWSKAKRIATAEVGSIVNLDLVADGRRVHLVYEEYGAEASRVFYQRSLNRGRTWRESQLLSDASLDSGSPTVVTQGTDVHVAWTVRVQARDAAHFPDVRLRLARSENRGRDFTSQRWISRPFGGTRSPRLVAEDDRLHLIWARVERKERGWVGGIYQRRSDSQGTKWTKRARVSAALASPSSLVAEAGRLHLAWSTGGYKESHAYYQRSDDRGASWSGAYRVNEDPLYAVSPTVAASGDDVQIVWVDNWLAEGPLHYDRSLDGGATWLPVESLGRVAGWPAIVAVPQGGACGGETHLVYASGDVFYRRTTAE